MIKIQNKSKKPARELLERALEYLEDPEGLGTSIDNDGELISTLEGALTILRGE